MNKYVVRCIKDIGVIMEGTMHIEETSRRKCKKAFRRQYRNWQIIDIRTKAPDGSLPSPEHTLTIDRDILS